jgi:hypothetical protein
LHSGFRARDKRDRITDTATVAFVGRSERGDSTSVSRIHGICGAPSRATVRRFDDDFLSSALEDGFGRASGLPDGDSLNRGREPVELGWSIAKRRASEDRS